MPLTLALPNKGRLQSGILHLLDQVGLGVSEVADRVLMAEVGDGGTTVLFARAQDIPEYVAIGAADAGFTGLDLVEETGAPVDVVLPLDFGHCKLVLAAPEGSKHTTLESIPSGARVATSFPNLTQRFFRERRKEIRIVPVSGAAEIAPTIGVADLICDLSATGSTLRENHLVVVATVMESHAVLIGRRGAPAEKTAAVQDFAAAIRSVLAAHQKRYLMANVPASALEQARALLPGVSGPTVMNLAGASGAAAMVAVHAVVGEHDILGLVPRLKKIGATGILVLPIERMVP